MPKETITTQLRLLGESAYLRGMYAAEAATRGLGESSIYAGSKAEGLGRRIDNLGSTVLRYGRTAALGAGIATAAVAKMGLEFNANMERAEIGMKTLLHSGEEARKTVTNVRDFALKAPLFGVEQMMNSAQQLIGAGYDAKKIVPYLTTFSDTISAMGRKPEDLQRMTYAFTQMMNKGQITAEELRGQLGEIFPAQKILAKQMGITSNELAKKLKEGGVKGVEPLLLLFKGMEERFGGATEDMSQTFAGQWANIKETAKYNAGVLFKPLFMELKSHVFPAISTFSGEWIKVLENNRLTAKQKWQATGRLFEVYLKPQIEQWGSWIEQADIPGKFFTVLDQVLPIMMDGFAGMAPRVAESFLNAFLEADAWTQVLTVGLLAAKFGMFSKVGGLVVDPFMTGFGTAMGGKKGQERIKTMGGRFGTKFGAAAGPMMVLGMLPFLTDLTKKIRDVINEAANKKKYNKKETRPPWDPTGPNASVGPGWGDIWNWLKGKEGGKSKKTIFGIPFGASGGPIGANKPMIVGEEGPELFMPKLAGTIIPNNLAMPSLAGAGNREIVVNSTLLLDGKVAARSVSRHNANVMARR